MSKAVFYHLTRSGEADALRRVTRRALEAGHRVQIRGGDGSNDASALEALDAALWMGAAEDFLPHGIEGGPHDALQPALLTPGDAALRPGRDCLLAVAGAGFAAHETTGLARACLIFDGGDETALTAARACWKAIRDAGQEAEYWSEASGRWELVRRAGGA